jgi:HEAT repeat protein
MQRLLLSGTLLLGLLGSADAQEPRAIIERAVKAMGMEPLKDSPPASYLKIKGKIFDREPFSMTGEVWQQFPDRQKVTMHLRSSDQDFVMTEALDGPRAWETLNDQTQGINGDALTELKEETYRDWVNSLLPLLRDKSITLQGLSESQVQGKAAVGVAVQSKGHAQIRLYFDKATGLLVKSEQRRKQGARPEKLIESYFSDYREVLSLGADEEILKKAQVAVDGPALIGFLKKQTLDDATRTKIRALIRKLGDSSFETREKAKEDLIARGQSAAALLGQAARDPDPEISSRARECLNKLGNGTDSTVLIAVLRLSAQRRPEGAAQALLAYVPCAPSVAVAQAAQGALVTVARAGPVPDPVVVKALQDPDEDRRRAAAIALGRYQAPGKEQPAYLLLVPGLKQAMKETSYREGKKILEYDVLDYQLFTRLPDREFAKP